MQTLPRCRRPIRSSPCSSSSRLATNDVSLFARLKGHVSSIRAFPHRRSTLLITRCWIPRHPVTQQPPPCLSTTAAPTPRQRTPLNDVSMPRRHCDGHCDPLAKERTINWSTISSSSSPSSESKAKRRGRLLLNRHPLRTQTLRRYQQKLVTMFLRYRRQLKRWRTSARSTGSRQCAQGTTGERVAAGDALGPARWDCNSRELEIVEDGSDCSSPRRSLSEDKHIFVSHSQEDLPLATTLMQKIESEGFRCFALERDSPPGPEVAALDSALKRSRRILLLLSRSYFQCRWCMYQLLVSVSHMYFTQKALIVPVIVDVREAEVPACLGTLSLVNMRNDPNHHKLMSNLKGPDVPVKELMPFGNVSHGLVWAYCLRYLKIILPGLSERIDRWCTKKKCVDVRMPRKLYIVVPASCRCPAKIKSADKRIHFGGHLEPVFQNSAGSVRRRYDLTVWNLQLRNGEVLQFVGEYPAIIDTLDQMDSQRSAGLNSQMKMRERDHFVHTLRRVLEADGSDRLVELVEFDDADGDGVTPLSEILTPYVERDRLCSLPSLPPKAKENRTKRNGKKVDGSSPAS